MKKSLTFWNTFPVLLIILGVLWLIGRFLIKRRFNASQPETIEDLEAEDVTQDDEGDPISQDEMIRNNYKVIRGSLPQNISNDFAKILTAQAMHETGIFRSKLYLENNNLFGMKHPVVRENLSTGEKNGYANFADLEDSVKDLLLWLKEFGVKTTFKATREGVSAYIKEIRAKGYFTDNYINYFNGVYSHLQTVKNLIQ